MCTGLGKEQPSILGCTLLVKPLVKLWLNNATIPPFPCRIGVSVLPPKVVVGIRGKFKTSEVGT